jgi:hypothetical protein
MPPLRLILNQGVVEGVQKQLKVVANDAEAYEA